jgi:hypothetical protein
MKGRIVSGGDRSGEKVRLVGIDDIGGQVEVERPGGGVGVDRPEIIFLTYQSPLRTTATSTSPVRARADT